MSELEKFDFSDIFPSEQSQFVRFDDIKDMINQPKLSIPKKIAEMLDYCFENEGGYEDVGYIVSNVDLLPEPDYAVYYEWLEETDDNKNYNLALAYLAGKALGVELVEVTDE